jgi:hypothetical protein
MTRARGQSSRTLLDREFPYQVLALANFKNQLALQMTRFADPVRLSGVSKSIPNDRGRPDRIGIKKSQHSLEMSTIANDVRS